MKVLMIKLFCKMFSFRMEEYYLYRNRATGMKVYKTDMRPSGFEDFISIKYVLRQK